MTSFRSTAKLDSRECTACAVLLNNHPLPDTSDFVCSSQSDYLEDREGVSRKLYFTGDLHSEHEHSIVHSLCIVEVAAACGY